MNFMEQNTKIEYRRVGDFMIPNLILSPEEAKVRLGKWGMMHKDYMLKHKKVTVAIMTAEGRFWQYLAEVDKQAEEMFSRLVSDMANAEGVSEKLKAEDQMLWVQRMMNIEARAREIIYEELIYV
ncbi:MAG: TnpV protein [Clostridia bacterium]|nr:TnpV protein [Clostridia bacterium]